jgi:hypothetical protein
MTRSGTETAIHTIGLDIANDSFSVHGFDVESHMVVTKDLKRGQDLMWFAKLPPARVGLEACASPHHRNSKTDNSHTNVTTNYASNGITIKAVVTETVDATGKLHYDYVDEDATNGYDTLNRQRIIEAAGIRVNEFITFNKDGSWRREELELRLAA